MHIKNLTNFKLEKFLLVVSPSMEMTRLDWRPISRLLNGLTRTATFTEDIVQDC